MPAKKTAGEGKVRSKKKEGKTKRKSRRTRKPLQSELPFPFHGGERPGAGRPRTSGETVPHTKRPPLSRHEPVHVTTRLLEGLPNMRTGRTLRVLMRSFADGKERGGFRLLHYAIVGNHLHLLVEADDRRSLSTGLQGLKVRIARALNRLWARRGRVFFERYHEHVLKTPREVYNALLYLFENARRHGLRSAPPLDPFTSAPWFDGWREGPVEVTGTRLHPIARARSWLMRLGWRRHGLLPLPT